MRPGTSSPRTPIDRLHELWQYPRNMFCSWSWSQTNPSPSLRPPQQMAHTALGGALYGMSFFFANAMATFLPAATLDPHSLHSGLNRRTPFVSPFLGAMNPSVPLVLPAKCLMVLALSTWHLVHRFNSSLPASYSSSGELYRALSPCLE